jgi:hypothetical protein
MLVNSLDFRIRQELASALLSAHKYDITMYVVYDDDNGWVASRERTDKREPYFRIDARKNHVEYISKNGDREIVEGELKVKGVMGGTKFYQLQ